MVQDKQISEAGYHEGDLETILKWSHGNNPKWIEGNYVITLSELTGPEFSKLERFGWVIYLLESVNFLLNEDSINANHNMMLRVLISSLLEINP